MLLYILDFRFQILDDSDDDDDDDGDNDEYEQDLREATHDDAVRVLKNTGGQVMTIAMMMIMTMIMMMIVMMIMAMMMMMIRAAFVKISMT